MPNTHDKDQNDFQGKRIFALRHAMASSDFTDRDINRELTPQGIEDAHKLGETMAKRGYVPDVILCSPARRTKQTLEAVQKAFDDTKTIMPEILYTGSTGDYLHEIQQVSDAHKNILIIAHNPSIYELVILIAAQGEDSVFQKLSQGYAPATLSVIHCACDQWSDIQPAVNELKAMLVTRDYNA